MSPCHDGPNSHLNSASFKRDDRWTVIKNNPLGHLRTVQGEVKGSELSTQLCSFHPALPIMIVRPALLPHLLPRIKLVCPDSRSVLIAGLSPSLADTPNSRVHV